ncbi:MAG: WbqC family protein [Methylomicrobium sp.]|nr:WbqC family protein [Methylomicrobium sp.]
MKLAIMQPYFFPYLGYFQLIDAVDAFVVYDDVSFIKGGWINRNFIVAQGEKSRITLQLQGASPNLPINQISIGGNRAKLLKSIGQSYAKAPQYAEVMPLLEEILSSDERNLAVFLAFSLRRICDYLQLRPHWYLSSELRKDNALRGQDKVLAICRELGATHYINVPGGRDLYDHASFESAGMRLLFLAPKTVEYSQTGTGFVPNLSIVDVMMFNSLERCRSLLKEYTLA